MDPWSVTLICHNNLYYHDRQIFRTLGHFAESIINDVPVDQEEYNMWITDYRDRLTRYEVRDEQRIFLVRRNPVDWNGNWGYYETPPSQLPRILAFNAFNVCILDLDREILTINYGIHFKLNNIPREGKLWSRVACWSVLMGDVTMSPDRCPVEHMASSALPLPPASEIEYRYHTVDAKSELTLPSTYFLTHVLGMVMVEYHQTLYYLGRAWATDSFPFRELAFAIVNIASGKVSFSRVVHNWRKYLKCNCCEKLRGGPGWFGRNSIGNKHVLLEFGSNGHKAGHLPGVAPQETIYWHESVLVSLALKVTGESINRTVTFGLESGRKMFQFMVMSLFEVTFGEVFPDDEGEPFVKVTESCNLSPVRMEDCLNTHPLERPPQHKVPESDLRRRATLSQEDVDVEPEILAKTFPGLASMVKFFFVAGDRQAELSQEASPFPFEIQENILASMDDGPWKTCLTSSNSMRLSCLRRYRIDDRMRLVSGPFLEKRHQASETPSVIFLFEDVRTGRRVDMAHVNDLHGVRGRRTWRPVISGSDGRQAIMLDVKVNYVTPGDDGRFDDCDGVNDDDDDNAFDDIFDDEDDDNLSDNSDVEDEDDDVVVDDDEEDEEDDDDDDDDVFDYDDVFEDDEEDVYE
ncbi:hypothetical protein CP532_4050 [Ophiocordyceps camponoti-leonardi (nom. inval.)]|nr:hypothetical protein CP532_4050 [Ophiocordyceps camponoti-leonardi (nom. inval.)]